MTEPADFNPEQTPVITLAGKNWPVPVLGWEQLQNCRDELLELTGRINDAIAADPLPDDAGDEARGDHNMAAMIKVFRGLKNEDYGRLVVGPIYAALTALHPSLSRKEFNSWPMLEGERQLAWLTVRTQSGMFTLRDKGNAPGEETGAPHPQK
jgi:hypothetical protein